MKMSFKHELEKLQRQLREMENHSSIKPPLNQPSSVSPQHPNHNPEMEKQSMGLFLTLNK